MNPWLIGGGAALGAASGFLGSEQSQTSSVNVGRADALERYGGQLTMEQLQELEGLVGAGPGMDSVHASNQANNQLADMLGQYAQGGFMPNEQQIGQSNQFAQQMFAPQQTMLNQQFDDQRQESARMAAQLGRAGNDPILQNKLMQTQAREQQMLGSQQTAFAAQQAQQMPLMQLGFQQDLAGLQSGLATQAMANRQALLGMGNQVQEQGRAFRLNTASRTTNQSQGGGMGGAIGGGLAGAGMGLQASNMFGVHQGQTAQGPFGMQTGGNTGNAFHLQSTGRIA